MLQPRNPASPNAHAPAAHVKSVTTDRHSQSIKQRCGPLSWWPWRWAPCSLALRTPRRQPRPRPRPRFRISSPQRAQRSFITGTGTCLQRVRDRPLTALPSPPWTPQRAQHWSVARRGVCRGRKGPVQRREPWRGPRRSLPNQAHPRSAPGQYSRCVSLLAGPRQRCRGLAGPGKTDGTGTTTALRTQAARCRRSAKMRSWPLRSTGQR
jgi:hypothetical protein